jgi:acetyltransferase-like isoleucine patch superfamily enzyme
MIGKVWVSRIQNKGKDLRIHGNIGVQYINDLKIGDYTRIGEGCYFFCRGGLIIKNNVQISRNVTIYTGNHNFNSNYIPYDNTHICSPVIIENSVWIGMNANILPGVTIGKGSIIGMGSTITKNIPPGSIVVGNNRIVKNRNKPIEVFDNESIFFGKVFPNS